MPKSFPQRFLQAATGLTVALLACEPTGSIVPLRQDEKVLVDAYVRLAVLENRRGDAVPESVDVAFDRLAQRLDSTAVQRAIAGLETDPRRWEYVYDAIVREFQRLENSPAPPSLANPRPGTP